MAAAKTAAKLSGRQLMKAAAAASAWQCNAAASWQIKRKIWQHQHPRKRNLRRNQQQRIVS